MKSAGNRSRLRFTCWFKLLDGDAIEFGEVAIEDDPLVAEDQDSRFDRYGELRRAFGHQLSIACLRSQFATSRYSAGLRLQFATSRL